MQIKTEILIEAPVEQVWETLIDFDNYPKWNPFIKEIKEVKALGQTFKVKIKAPNQKPMSFAPNLLEMEPNKSFRWKGKLLFRGLFDGEHYFQLLPDGNGKTLLLHGELFTGILVKFIMKRIAKDTIAGFDAMNQALKEQVESQLPLLDH